MKVIGLAGEAGCGKSAAARCLAARDGIVWVDLDRIAWEEYRPKSPVYERLIARFGKGIIASDDRIDRRRLGKLVFSDEKALSDLNAIVHPAVSERLRAIVSEQQGRGTEVLLVEGALLGISPYVDYSLFDAVLWLEAGFDERRERLLAAERPEHLHRSAQGDPMYDMIVIDAEGSIEETARQIVGIIESL